MYSYPLKKVDQILDLLWSKPAVTILFWMYLGQHPFAQNGKQAILIALQQIKLFLIKQKIPKKSQNDNLSPKYIHVYLNRDRLE